MEVKVKIVNNSSFCDYVPVYLFANGNLVGGNSTNITQGSTEYITICYTPTTAGDNTLKLTADASGNNVYCTGSVYVEDGAPADLTMTYSLPGANSSYQVVGDELSIKTNIKNNKTTAYNDYISVNFYKKQGASNKYSLQNTVTKIVNVPGSSTKNETFSFSDLAPGKYFAIFYYYNVNNKVEAFRTVAIELIMKGDVNGDGVITATDVTALYEYLLNGSTTNLKFGDQNGDGLITSSDVTAIYKILLGNVTK